MNDEFLPLKMPVGIASMDISLSAKVIYARINSFADGCYMTNESLGSSLHLSRNTVSSAINELKRVGLIDEVYATGSMAGAGKKTRILTPKKLMIKKVDHQKIGRKSAQKIDDQNFGHRVNTNKEEKTLEQPDTGARPQTPTTSNDPSGSLPEVKNPTPPVAENPVAESPETPSLETLFDVPEKKLGGHKPADIEEVRFFMQTYQHKASGEFPQMAALHIPHVAQDFWDYYEGNGWKQGRNPLKDWTKAAQRWMRGQGTQRGGAPMPQWHETRKYDADGNRDFDAEARIAMETLQKSGMDIPGLTLETPVDITGQVTIE